MRRDDGPSHGASEVGTRERQDQETQTRGLAPPRQRRHLPAHPEVMRFRYRNRQNQHLFRDVLLRLIGAESISYAELVRADARHD
jgi:hypothetical protein